MADNPATTETALTTPVVVKKYANRRLYNTETSSYITLENLADMIRAGRDFVVYDAKSGDDITRGVLTQIIVEEESKGSAMLPTNFLRQLIGFYGGNLQGVVPSYLEHAMTSFARQQQQMRQVVQQTFGPFIPAGVEEMGRQNMAMFERAMSIFNPFVRGIGTDATAPATAPGPASDEPAPPAPDAAAHAAEIEALRRELDSLRTQLAIARADSVASHAAHAPHDAPAAEPPPSMVTTTPPHPPAPQAEPEATEPPSMAPAPASAPPASALAVPRRIRTGKKGG